MKKTMIKILLAALGLEILTRFYGLFAHGVSSVMMEVMPVTALIGGLILVGMKTMIRHETKLAEWFDLIGICALALLINYQFMEGVLTIAGGSSSLAIWLLNLSLGFALLALILLVKGLRRKSPINP